MKRTSWLWCVPVAAAVLLPAVDGFGQEDAPRRFADPFAAARRAESERLLDRLPRVAAADAASGLNDIPARTDKQKRQIEDFRALPPAIIATVADERSFPAVQVRPHSATATRPVVAGLKDVRACRDDTACLARRAGVPETTVLNLGHGALIGTRHGPYLLTAVHVGLYGRGSLHDAMLSPGYYANAASDARPPVADLDRTARCAALSGQTGQMFTTFEGQAYRIDGVLLNIPHLEESKSDLGADYVANDRLVMQVPAAMAMRMAGMSGSPLFWNGRVVGNLAAMGKADSIPGKPNVFIANFSCPEVLQDMLRSVDALPEQEMTAQVR